MAAIDFYKLKPGEKTEIFKQISVAMDIHEAAVEKDWWVVQTLALIFEMDISEFIIFKGGTSLSKGWNLIERFSEDIDLALDKKFLGFEECHTVKQVKKLRSATRKYIYTEFIPALQQNFIKAGYSDVIVEINEEEGKNLEPVRISINYESRTAASNYTRSRIIVEIGSRSMREPFSIRNIISLVGEKYAGRTFADKAIPIPTVNPERTLLEKIFLLHEEFQKEESQIRANRLSRHLYDIERLMNTEYADKAIQNRELYNDIIRHRSIYTKISDIDYGLHQPGTLNFAPPLAVINDWEKDYQLMQEVMIYGESIPFRNLIENIKRFNEKIKNQIG
jgi:hypothetical protein